MRILFTICGRAGSKGLKNKNIMEFLGYPLAFYSVSAIDMFLKKHPEIEANIVLNTDSKQLINLFKDGLNLRVDIIERDPSLGLDSTPKLDVIKNSYMSIKAKYNLEYDMVVDLDITSPIRTVKDIENLVNKKLSSEAEIIFSVTKARRNPYFNMVKQASNGYYTRVIESDFYARQEAPETFDMNASLYAYSPDFLINNKPFFSSNCSIILMEDFGVLDIDDDKDSEVLQVIASYIFSKYPHYKEISTHINHIMR